MAQLTNEQYTIGRLPWVEMTRSDAPREGPYAVSTSKNEMLKFARLDLGLLPGVQAYELQGLLADNHIVSTSLRGTYLEVALADTSGKNLDALRLAATDWELKQVNDRQVLVARSDSSQSAEFLNKAQFGDKVNPKSVLESVRDLYQRYGVAVELKQESGLYHLEAPADQGAKITAVRARPLDFTNQPYNHEVEAAKARQLAETKPTGVGRAAAGAAFGVAASIPAMVETYKLAEQDMENGKVPMAAASYATRYAAEAVAGGVAGSATAVAATPLLAIPPPAGEIAYGAAVLGAGYLGAEGTRQLMQQADYYMAKAKEYFQDDQKQEMFNAHVESNAIKAGLNPEVAVVYANRMLVNETEAKSAHSPPAHQEQGMEP